MTVSYRTEESRPARSAVARSLAAIAAAERNEVWTSRFPDEALSAEADRIDDAAAAGLELPLLGLTFAVKVFDEGGLIGEGRRQRAVIDVARFLERVQAKAKGARRATR